MSVSIPPDHVQSPPRALKPYLRHLEETLLALPEPSPASETPVELRFGKATIEVHPWVLSRLRSRGAGVADDLPDLLFQVVALILKSAVDLSRLTLSKTGDRQRLYMIEGELMLDGSLGAALLDQLQGAVDGKVQRGEVRQARIMMSLFHRLRRALADSQPLLANLEDRRNRSPEGTLPRDLDPDAGPSLVAKPVFERPQARARERRAAGPFATPLPSRREFLLAIVALLLVVWIGGMKLPGWMHPQQIVLTLADLPTHDAVVGMRARPPSAYLDVDGSTWDLLDEATKRRRVDEVAAVLEDYDYQGALWRTVEGRPVALWLREGGTRLLKPKPLDGGASATASRLAR